MTELKLRQMFKNLSDCYADTGRFENDGSYTEGEVIQAMTEDRFIEALKEAKLLPIPAVSGQLVDFLTWYIHKSEFSKDTYSIKLIVDEYLKSTNLH